jgi:hypothetical protein
MESAETAKQTMAQQANRALRAALFTRISIDNSVPRMYLQSPERDMPDHNAPNMRQPERGIRRRASGHGTTLLALAAALTLALTLPSCQNPDPVAKEKARTLTSDERYLVEYYMKIMEFDKYLHGNPADAEEKRLELEKGLDRDRIKRTLAELQKRPERWLAIYNRINELQVRALQEPR